MYNTTLIMNDDKIRIERVNKASVRTLSDEFYRKVFDVFSDPENNIKAGVQVIKNPMEMRDQVNSWFNDSSIYMYFLYYENELVGSLQAFEARAFGINSISVGYIVKPGNQGKGLGTIMLREATRDLVNEGYNIMLGFRDGNYASEKLAIKNNYKYHARVSVSDIDGNFRPMTYYKYEASFINESKSLLDNKSILLEQVVKLENGELRRVNPSIISLEEYIYFSSSPNWEDKMANTYFIYGPLSPKTTSLLKSNNIFTNRVVIDNKSSKEIFLNHDDIDTNLLEDFLAQDLDNVKVDGNIVVLTNETFDWELKLTVKGSLLFITSFDIKPTNSDENV